MSMIPDAWLCNYVMMSRVETQVMEMNRNQYLMLGIVVLLLGVQFRMIESFVLNAEATIAELISPSLQCSIRAW